MTSFLERLRGTDPILMLAIRSGCPSMAFTYNEPTIWGEYVIDICKVARARGLKTVMVSNGYVTYEAFHDIYDHIDAANIDLKAFTEKFYGGTTLAHLEPVLDTLKWLKNETDVWFEITNLLIPTLNDAPAETRALSEWILENLGPDVPLQGLRRLLAAGHRLRLPRGAVCEESAQRPVRRYP